MSDITMEQQKLLAEIEEMNASTRKMLAEISKLHFDMKIAPVQIAATAAGAAALVIGAITTVVKVLGG